MVSFLFGRITFVWLFLLGATILSTTVLGHGVGFQSIQHNSIAIIVVAFIKARFVLLDFMELRHAPLFMRLIAEAWLVIICSILVTLYLK
jgi:Prokaryotic Cytochrome C oxidase subunit IV